MVFNKKTKHTGGWLKKGVVLFLCFDGRFAFFGCFFGCVFLACFFGFASGWPRVESKQPVETFVVVGMGFF